MDIRGPNLWMKKMKYYGPRQKQHSGFVLTLFPTRMTGVLWSASAIMQTSARLVGLGDKVRLQCMKVSSS